MLSAPCRIDRASPRGTGASRLVLAAVVALTLAASGHAQPCNPAIDGTYCASQPDPGLISGSGSGSDLLSGARIDLGPSPSQPGLYDTPATLGAVTFGGGTSCIGLLRRARCN
jgi:hypothetical protein